jgi:hypothetical protein
VGDRVPIGTHPGLVTGLVDQDLVVATMSQTVEVSEVWLRRTDHAATGQVVADLRNATGGGGSGITVTLGDAIDSASATGTLTGTAFYLRVSAADALSQNLTGWFRVSESASTTAALTNLARVKRFLGETSSTHDTLLSEIIAGQSAAMASYMHRAIVEQTITGERHDGRGTDRLVLREFPVTSVAEVRLDGTAVAAATYELGSDSGLLYRRDGLEAGCFDLGRRNWQVDYTAGYATVPEDLAEAATRQAGTVWLSAEPGDNRLGTRGSVLDVGSVQYLTGPWAPGVAAVMDAYRRREAA